MAKLFNTLLAGILVVPSAQSTTLVNTGNTPIYVVDQETNDALSALEPDEAMTVKGALFSIKPGGSQKLVAGTYVVDFADSISASAVTYIVQSAAKAPKMPAPVVPPATNPDDQKPQV